MCTAFMNERDQKSIDIQEKKIKNEKSMYKVNGELSSCDITYSAELHPERATYTTLHNHFS